MEKMEKRYSPQRRFFLGKMVIMVLCMIACSNAQIDGVQNRPMVKENAEKNPFHCGDAVSITISPDTASFLTGDYAIDDEGYIDLPLVGKKQVLYMTQEELASFVNSSFIKYLRYPSVQVRPLLRIELVGGFLKPGFYYISPHASLWEAIRLAGAPMREDGIEKLQWKRSRKTVDYDLVYGIEKAQSLKQMGIRSGDQIIVTARPLQTAWDRFKDDVLPILSLTLSLAATTATAYISYETFQGRR